MHADLKNIQTNISHLPLDEKTYKFVNILSEIVNKNTSAKPIKIKHQGRPWINS